MAAMPGRSSSPRIAILGLGEAGSTLAGGLSDVLASVASLGVPARPVP